MIKLARNYLEGAPDKENVAYSLFRFPGSITAGQVRAAMVGKSDRDYINLRQSRGGKLEVDVWCKDQLRRFFRR
jgi:hypothetical protein